MFSHKLNILQYVCYHNAESVFNYLREMLKDEPERRKELAAYPEPYGGNMAIHFAVLKGNRRIISALINEF